MVNGQETELKFEIPQEAVRNVEDAPPLREANHPPETQHLTSVYFDTRSGKLRDKGLSLRVRYDGEHHIQTIKADTGSFSRGEWETEVSGRMPDLDAARGTALEPLLSKKL